MALAVAGRPGPFGNNSFSDDSMCIYVDSSFDSLNSELIDSDVENFDLNSSCSSSCEDLSSNETLSSKLLDTDIENCDLNSSFSNNSEDLSSNETFTESNETISEPSLGKLRVYYTNADSLLN